VREKKTDDGQVSRTISLGGKAPKYVEGCSWEREREREMIRASGSRVLLFLVEGFGEGGGGGVKWTVSDGEMLGRRREDFTI